MSTITENPAQNLNVRQTETEQPDLVKERVKTDKLQDQDSDMAQVTKDRVDIQNSSLGSTEANQGSNEIKDADEAQKSVSVEDVAGLIKSEGGKASAEQVHNLNPGSLIDILV